MSESFNGAVEAVRKDRKGVKIGGEWYSVRNASAFGDVAKGDTCSGTYTKNGQWINCDEASIKVTKGSSGGGGGSTGGGGGGGGNDQFRTRPEIIRTTCLESAVAYHSEPGSDYGSDMERILKTSELFVAYVSGLIDVSALSEDSAEAEAQPEPEPEPEPEPAAQPSALSNFLGS